MESEEFYPWEVHFLGAANDSLELRYLAMSEQSENKLQFVQF